MTAYAQPTGETATRTGLMGGTLNPIHIAHLVIAETAREAFNLDRVVWIPAGDPPHKPDEGLAPQEDRYEMTRLATASNSNFEVSRLELEREGPSYSLLTIQHFREKVGAEDLFFIAGADTVLELLTWYRHEEVIKLCRFIAAARPGYNLDRMKTVLPPEYIQRIDVLEVPQVDVSSTEIRERVREGRSIRYLTPDPVVDYIRDRGLYR
jgi:nicotinate-nucleotide adenylyltransferase